MATQQALAGKRGAARRHGQKEPRNLEGEIFLDRAQRELARLAEKAPVLTAEQRQRFQKMLTDAYEESTEHMLIAVDAPTEFRDLKLPPGQTIDRWYKSENQRLARMYPRPMYDATEISPSLVASFTAATGMAKLGDVKRRLAKLEGRKQMGFAQHGTINGFNALSRLEYDNRGYTVKPFHVDTIVGA